MDGNGTSDLVTVSNHYDLVEVFLGTSSGSLEWDGIYDTAASPVGVAIADMNSDGLPDAIVACEASGALSLLVGMGGGELALAIDSPAGPARHIVAGDLNHDGIPDVVVAEPVQDRVTAHLCDGVGSYLKYCRAEINSLGCLPRLIAHGTPSLSDLSLFRIGVTNLRSAQVAMFLYKVGGVRGNLPFQGGTLCIGPAGIRRTPPRSTGGYPAIGQNCSGGVSIYFNMFALGLAGGNPDPALLVPGNTYRVQLWARDGGASFGAVLSSAIEVTPWL